ncbi:protein ripply3 [Dermochelys coriacea]|uniref:protein ripply3 n=1 Tax=Dermochelys coriacea TaxID=27794 RepID=UPI0018E90A28|nr:protein ripply3 [Dermochelys coriacea]
MPGEAASQAQEHKTADRQASTMEAEAAKFLIQATVTQICHSSRDIQPHSLHPREQPESNSTLWRPWILTARDAELGHQGMSDLDGDQRNFSSKGALGFQHPVRLYLPKSKSQKFLHNIGKKVLASFPVQATIHFYNDDSDSEDDEEERNSAL